MKRYEIISEEFISNCLIQAIWHKLKDWKHVKIFASFKNKHIHFMWSDGKYDYDFSDNGQKPFKWYHLISYRGVIRKFDLGFAEWYKKYKK